MLPYLAAAESWAPWFIWLFAVIYSQQMRGLNPKQTHAQLPPPAPRSLCPVCSFQPASDITCWSLKSMGVLCVSDPCHCICRMPVISLSVAKWGIKVLYLEVQLTFPPAFYSFPSCSYQFSSLLKLLFFSSSKSSFFGLCCLSYITTELSMAVRSDTLMKFGEVEALIFK